jgi:nucleoside-triphosphatase THEP1
MYLIITGQKGAGKSVHLLRLAEYLKNRGKTAGGVISRSVWRNGEREGYEIVNPGTGVFPSRRLCVKTLPDVPDSADVLRFCSYYFLRSAFAEGNRWIAEGLTSDVLFIDEVGNLELSGSGWNIADALKSVSSAVLGVREDAVPKLQSVWGITGPVIAIPPGEDMLDVIVSHITAVLK